MEIETTKSLQEELFVDKSDNQRNYMKELQDCIEKNMPQMIEIVRTEEKIDSTLRILLNFKIQYPENYKKIVICCQRSQDTTQYFEKATQLAEKYPEIKEKLLILKVSNKRNLCIEPTREDKYDEEIFCKYKRKVDTNKCKFYEEFRNIVKSELSNRKGIYDQNKLVQEGKMKGFCSYFAQNELIKDADIIICEHKNIFKDEDKQQDIYQFIPMQQNKENKGTFLFVDQSQYLYEDIQTYNTFNIEQQVIHQAVNKCRQLKQVIYEQVELVKKNELVKNNKVTDFFKKDYNDLMSKLEKQMLKAVNDQENGAQEKPQQFPAYVKHPILLVEFLQNVSLELNQWFENHFNKKKNDLDRQNNFNNAHHASAPILVNEKIPKEDLQNLKNLYPMKIKLRLVIDELLSYMFKYIYPENSQEKDDTFQSLYIIGDFLYFFNLYYQSNDYPLRVFFQDHPEYLKEAIYYPILTCTPSQIKNFSKRIFDTSSNYILTSDCILQKNQMRTTTVLGLQKLANLRQNFFPRFDLEDRVKFNCKPMFFTKWNDQSTFQSQKIEHSPLQLRNYVNIINRVSEFTPDGIVVYLPNIAVFFRFIKEKVDDILSKRPVYFESPFSPEKTKEAFNYYKTNCDNGQGSFFFCVANGWASRHLEFQDHCARAVLILGYPKRQEFYQYISHDKKIYGLEEEDFYTLDSMTKVTQCIKSVYTHTTDYCTIILADTKLRADSDYLPAWANQNLKGQDELTVDDLFQEILLNQRAMGKLYG
ncbi:helicase carboxy-terminal domain protein (macronuclear) [Tetrahymena thermophila SB210]|uniref:Helicase carboxy-terminal domain protein n=1 Tax=Tetrahymena thermophila (strain SB210) TaxID=312017 RepID=I7LXA1_TETTS|nr:helicase carboxy-terminal domain protein [Tetrahymena thermophila SB210]EAS04239.2 helicase carboxy-terminal domain protein [Tetrahymena thermophila SB210]|eukprot:XP_001024484.2 helicase carboxy-terminal domain protein [Tetrahymena thermophila SB210]